MKKGSVNVTSIINPDLVMPIIKNLLLAHYIEEYPAEYKSIIAQRLDDVVFIFDSNPKDNLLFISSNIGNINDLDFIRRTNLEFKNYESIENKINKKLESMLRTYITNHFERSISGNGKVLDLDFESYSAGSIDILNSDDDSKRNELLSRQHKYKVDSYFLGIEPITKYEQIDDIICYKRALLKYKNQQLVSKTKWGKRIKQELREKYCFTPNDEDLVELLFDDDSATTAILKDNSGESRCVVHIPLVRNSKFGNLDRILYHELRHVIESTDHSSGLYDFKSNRYNSINEVRTEMHALEDEQYLMDFLFFGRGYDNVSLYESLIPLHKEFFDNNKELFDMVAIDGKIDVLERLIGEDYLDKIESDLQKRINSIGKNSKVRIKSI